MYVCTYYYDNEVNHFSIEDLLHSLLVCVCVYKGNLDLWLLRRQVFLRSPVRVSARVCHVHLLPLGPPPGQRSVRILRDLSTFVLHFLNIFGSRLITLHLSTVFLKKEFTILPRNLRTYVWVLHVSLQGRKCARTAANAGIHRRKAIASQIDVRSIYRYYILLFFLVSLQAR